MCDMKRGTCKDVIKSVLKTTYRQTRDQKETKTINQRQRAQKKMRNGPIQTGMNLGVTQGVGHKVHNMS
jgi:hypothetical protein